MEKLTDRAAEGNSGKMLMNFTPQAVRTSAVGGDAPQDPDATSWLSVHVNNNNNSLTGIVATDKEKQFTKEETNAQKSWNCESCAAVGGSIIVGANYNKHTSSELVCPASATVEDKGGGLPVTAQSEEPIQNADNSAILPISGHAHVSSTLAAIAIPDSSDDIAAAVGAAAASLTPPGDSHSNRTSINNSTENLSYSSDNYPDDLIVLDDDEDDCVYAYRGDGADFDLALDAITGRRGVADAGLADDETDFLEMDFEPDPLSEVEYGGSVEMAPHADAFLMQRDSCHLSGRHSANMSLHAHTQRHLLFSSPIDDLPPPANALQSQALLSKNLARITLHLDQIKGGECGDGDVAIGLGFERTLRNERLPPLLCGSDDIVDNGVATTTTAHSLPNSLHANFGRDLALEKPQTKLSPSKVTGAKPKRLSTFSTSSSTSSKNSSKSRTSLRSAFAPALCSSSSFDERSVSCTEFRSSAPPDEIPLSAVPTVANCDDFNATDETCLDCLEKEFLANTIGKAMDPNECPKCRKRTSSISLYTRASAQTRGSPSFFNEGRRDECIFDVANDFLNTRKREIWSTPIQQRTTAVAAGAEESTGLTAASSNEGDGITDGVGESGAVGIQRSAKCDNYSGEQLKNLLSTDSEIVTISTLNLNEEMLVQALDKLHTPYNVELVQSHFRSDAYAANPQNSVKDFKNLKCFILHESKKNCNHAKLRRLIELATHQQVNVEFRKDANITQTEMLPIKVADILHHWTRTKNLELLKQLDKRFVEANVLGKIANIVRQQAEQRCNTRRPLPEFISIPQYYASGYLTLSKKS